MQFRKQYLWLGAAALLAVSLLAMLLAQPPKDAPHKAANEPDLFKFLQPMESPPPIKSRHYSATGELVVDAELERLFGYLISGYGEKLPAAMTAEMDQQITRHFRAEVVDDAKRLFSRYLAYRRELIGIENGVQAGGNAVAAARARLDEKRKIRSRYFSPTESERLFSLEDASEIDAATRLDINQNASLSDAQRRESLAAVDSAAPAVLREAQEAPLKAVKLEEAAKQMRAEGASDDEVFRLRANTYSPEVAQRLAEAEQKEKAWQGRIASYIAERTRLMEDPSVPYANRAAALQQLRDSHFTPDEQRLITLYE